MTNTSPQRENESDEQYVTRLMEEAVATKGAGYVYPQRLNEDDDPSGCAYIRDGEPSCIVGHVLVAAGVDPNELHLNWEGTAAGTVIPAVGPWPEGPISDALDAAQKAQDGGLSWGAALERFKETLEAEA